MDDAERYGRAKAPVASLHGVYGRGIGLAIHAYNVFGTRERGLGGDWRERRIRGEMERSRRSGE